MHIQSISHHLSRTFMSSRKRSLRKTSARNVKLQMGARPIRFRRVQFLSHYHIRPSQFRQYRGTSQTYPKDVTFKIYQISKILGETRSKLPARMLGINNSMTICIGPVLVLKGCFCGIMKFNPVLQYSGSIRG